jgi:Uma2 family endonuclease
MVTPIAAERRFTAADLLEMENGSHYELLDGQLKERTVSRESSKVNLRLGGKLVAYVDDYGLGTAYDSELGIRIFPDPERTRRADLSFLRADRVPPGDSGFLVVSPDLVVEVVSPSDHMSEVRAKVAEWLSAGVRLVWVVLPEAREIHVYRANGHPEILTSEDHLEGDDVVPGFHVPVAGLFARAPASPAH